MAHLGDFTSAVRELTDQEKDTFTVDGETFTVGHPLPAILLIQLGASMTGKVEEIEGFGAMWEAWRCGMGEEEFARFHAHVRDHNTDTETLVKLAMAVFESQAGRPTVPAPASAAGSPATSPSSSVQSGPQAWHAGSSAVALQRMRPVSEVLAG